MKLPTSEEPVLVVQGDALQILPSLPVGAAHVLITDPPYGVGMGVGKDSRGGSPTKRHGLAKPAYSSGADTYEEYVRVVPPAVADGLRITGGRGAVFVGPHIWDLPRANVVGGVYCPSAVGRNAWGFKNLLPVLLYGKAPDLHKGAKEPTVWRSTERATPNGHPCPKPLSWMRWLVRLCSRPGELILDPFGGSGTTAEACQLEGRRCLLIEKEAAYVDIARRRLASLELPMMAGV